MSGFFRDRRIESARLDAELLLSHVLSCSRIDLYTMYDAEVGHSDRAVLREMVRERARGKPVAYLLGHREFYSLDFEVNSDVLIPRPETELLVDAVLLRTQREAPFRALDLGTGSGAIAVTVAVERPQASVVALDSSPAAMVVAKQNADRHGVADRIQFREGHLFEPVDVSSPLDLIVSNPPYVRTHEWESLASDVRDYEPRMALDAGPDGLNVLKPIISASPDYLRTGGWLMLEFGIDQATILSELIRQTDRFEEPMIVDDLAKRPRVILAQRR